LLGQIYSPERNTGRILERKHIVGDTPFTKTVLPTESVQENFEQYPIPEIDDTFSPLLFDERGSPPSSVSTVSYPNRRQGLFGALKEKKA
jgi:hypothetical protein